MINQILSIIETECQGNKIQFCIETKIKRDLLYSILSGRNKNPGVNTIQKIKIAYPTINLNWLISDAPEKYIFQEKHYQMIISELEKEIRTKNILIDYLKSNNLD